MTGLGLNPAWILHEVWTLILQSIGAIKDIDLDGFHHNFCQKTVLLQCEEVLCYLADLPIHNYSKTQSKTFLYFCFSHGVGGPVVGEIDGEYHYDHKRSLLEWQLPVIDSSNKNGSLEFSVAGHPSDFFPVAVTFISSKSYCDVKVSFGCCTFLRFIETVCILLEIIISRICCFCRVKLWSVK